MNYIYSAFVLGVHVRMQKKLCHLRNKLCHLNMHQLSMTCLKPLLGNAIMHQGVDHAPAMINIHTSSLIVP